MLTLALNAIYRQLKAMIEIVAALLIFLGVSVFLAHAFDAYRTG
jgi:hypothetical protein